MDNLNILQFIHCLESVFFKEKASENYIQQLFLDSKKFKRANQPIIKSSYLFGADNRNEEDILSQKENLVITGSTDCAIKLKLDGIMIHSGAQGRKLHPSAAQLRPHASKLLNSICR